MNISKHSKLLIIKHNVEKVLQFVDILNTKLFIFFKVYITFKLNEYRKKVNK